jgi:A/G-specific adenine glycosylase
MEPARKQAFTPALMHWYQHHNHRPLPWKDLKDPYRIWLSEIMLQQTRAGQGLPYYERFTKAYPTLAHLAAAPDEEVFRLWQGLGYYNRCRNMLATARHIMQELGGHFPQTYEGLLALKGIGPYTAAAIASFAWGLPYAVLDGNVNRVLARVFGMDEPFDSPTGKKVFQNLATGLLDASDSAAWNQAIMDLGATVCTPLAPRCPRCPMQQFCIAFNQGLIAELPVRRKRPELKHRYFHYILLRHAGKIWMHQRLERDIWQDLHEPFLIEAPELLERAALEQRLVAMGLQAAQLQYEGALSQRLTHQQIHSRFYHAELVSDAAAKPLQQGFWLEATAVKNLALPRTLVSYFEKKLYF